MRIYSRGAIAVLHLVDAPIGEFICQGPGVGAEELASQPISIAGAADSCHPTTRRTALAIDPIVEASFRLPQSQGAVLASLEGGAIIDEKRFEGNLVFLRARGPASLLDRYRRFRERSA
jgi:hypothetical protein